MQTAFIVNETRIAPEEREAGYGGVTNLHTSGVDSVKETVIYAVRTLGIEPRSHTEPWFASSYHQEDRDYFEEGMEKYYCLHFPQLSPRALLRVDQMLRIARKEKPNAL